MSESVKVQLKRERGVKIDRARRDEWAQRIADGKITYSESGNALVIKIHAGESGYSIYDCRIVREWHSWEHEVPTPSAPEVGR